MMKLNPKSVKGEVWDEGGKSGILQIMISHEERKINSFQFTYVDQKGHVSHSKIHGQLNGWNFNIVTFDYPSEFLTSLSGVYNNFQELIVIAFGSNKRMYGPFGMTKTGDAPEFAELCSTSYRKFNYEFGSRSSFAGFHGRVNHSCVSVIGVYINPITSLDQLKPVDSHVNEPEPQLGKVKPDPIDSLSSKLNIK